MRRLQNFRKILMSHIVETFWLSFETVFGIVTWITWSEFAVQIKRFLELWKFFKNHGITWGTSDFDFCDLLDELFHMAKKHFFEKNESLKSYFQVPYGPYDMVHMIWSSSFLGMLSEVVPPFRPLYRPYNISFCGFRTGYTKNFWHVEGRIRWWWLQL